MPFHYPEKPKVDSVNLFDLLWQSMEGILSKVLTGNSAGLMAPFAFLADLMGLRHAQSDRHETDIQDLKSTTDDLSQATGHATAYMPTSPGTTTSPTRMPFTAQSGTRRGVTNLGNGQWRLDSAGEWDIDAQVEFWGGELMPADTYLEIIVRRPDGVVHDGVRAIADSVRNITVTNVTSTQVPTAGYTVEVLAWTGAIPLLGTTRGIRGGYATTRLKIRKFEMLRE